MAVVNQQAKDAAKSNTASNTTNRKQAETVDATTQQQESFEIQLQNAQSDTQRGLLAIAEANSDVLADQVLQLTQNLTSFKVVKGVAGILLGGNGGVSEVTTAFLFGTPRSGFQIADAIAKLQPTQPLLLQAIGMNPNAPQLQAFGSTNNACLAASNVDIATFSDK